MPGLLADDVRRGRRRDGRLRPHRHGRPDVPRRVRRRVDPPRPPRPRGDDRGDPRVRRRHRGGGVRAVLRLARAALPRRDGDFIDTNYDSVLDLVRPWRAALRLLRLGGFRRLGPKVASFFDDERLQRIFSFQSMYAGLAPVRGAVAVRRHHVHGLGRGRLRPAGGMHAMAAGLAAAVEKAGAEIRYDSPVSRILRDGSGRVTGVELGGGERIAADAVVCNADLPVAYRTLLGGVDAPAGRPPRAVLAELPAVGRRRARAAAGRRRAPQHPLRPRLGRLVPARIIHDGVRMPDPSILVTLHSLDDPSLAPAGLDASTCSSRPRTSTGRSTGRASGTGRWTAARPVSRRSATRPTSSSSASTTRSTGRRWGWSGARRSRSPTRSSRPGRSARTTSTVACPGLVFTGSSTVPGVGVPMVLLSGKLAAQRVDEYARPWTRP